MPDGAAVSDEPTEASAALRAQAVRALGHLVRPRSYLGLAREVALATFHLGAYPLGLLPAVRPIGQASDADADASGAAHEVDDARAGLPVVLVHGYVHNRSAFLVMARALKRAGFEQVHGLNYNPLIADLPQIALGLASEVQRVRDRTGAERVALVGHSMGGIVARHYVQLLGGYDTVETVITLGAPHRGSVTSHLGLGPAAKQLRPGSAYLRRLEESARPSRVRWIAYYSDLDLLVVPAVSGKLSHPALAATNVRVNDTGHLSLLLSSEVLTSVIAHLAGGAGAPAGGAEAATPLRASR